MHLEATSQYGCFDDTTITIEVYPYIYAKFTMDRPAICSDEFFTIDRSSSQVPSIIITGTIRMTGITDEDKTDPIFDYTYSNTGNTAPETHTIRLTVTNAQGCDTSWTENMTVHPEVRAAFTSGYRRGLLSCSNLIYQ